MQKIFIQNLWNNFSFIKAHRVQWLAELPTIQSGVWKAPFSHYFLSSLGNRFVGCGWMIDGGGFADDGLNLEIGCESQEGSGGFSRIINGSCPPLSHDRAATSLTFGSTAQESCNFYFVFPPSNRYCSWYLIWYSLETTCKICLPFQQGFCSCISAKNCIFKCFC